MKKANFNWQLPAPTTDAQVLIPWLEENNYSAFLAPLLWQRNIRQVDQLASFFKPTVAEIHDPFLMYGMAEAVARITSAVENDERILIYGDYDADGITSTTVMKEAIESLGCEVICYLPNRFTDGYGPNQKTYARLIAEEGIQLIVTVDNGVSGHEAIKYAQSIGVDVVVTDHHELPAELPEAFAIVHPQHPAGDYPFKDLAGVGVAFKVATALLGELPLELLDLVALGTIADLVSLSGENRVLVQLGLEIIKSSDRIGLQALCEVAGVTQMTMTDENVAFALVPRLNALGRLGDANPAVTLLSTFDEEEGQSIAQLLETTNQERKELGAKITAEALAMVREMPPHEIYVLAKAGWHEGILGIVASKIVEETGRPALVLGIDEEKQIAKGSARGVEQVNLHEALTSAKELFISFGGHQMAAGMSLPVDRIADLQLALDHYIKDAAIDFSNGPTLNIDGQLEVDQITVDLISQINELSPFGTDNPAPYFLLNHGQSESEKQLGLDKNTLKFEYVVADSRLDCIGFSLGAALNEFATAEKVDVVGQLKINEWNGRRKPQLMLKDYQINDFQLFDLRGKQLNVSDFQVDKTLFVYFAEKTGQMFKTSPMAQQLYFTGSEDIKLAPGIDQLVFLDCPTEADLVRQVVMETQLQRVYLVVASPEQAYLNGMPSREHFAKLFKFIKQHRNIDIRFKLEGIANYLKIEKNLLIFMINVFFDLGFVTIDNGVMNQVEKPNTRPLDESHVYQTRALKIKAEEFLLYSSLSEIRQWLLSQEEKK